MSLNDQIFISYSRQDESFARKLAIWLARTLEIGVWIDIEDIPAGIKWSQAIQEGLDNAHVMIVIVTPESMASQNVEDEWQYFIDQNKPIIPILLRSTRIPYQLKRFAHIDFSDKDDYPNALRELLTELRQHVKPLPGEGKPRNRRRRAKFDASPTVSARERKVEQQLKKQRRLVTTLAVITFILVVAFAGFVVFVLMNQPSVRVAFLSSVQNARITLPGEDTSHVLEDGEYILEGSIIETNDSSLVLTSDDHDAEIIVEPHTDAALENFTDTVQVGLSSGGVAVNTGELATGTIRAPGGLNIDVQGETAGVAVDTEAKTINTQCFDATCTLSDEDTGASLTLSSGQELEVDAENPDFNPDNIREISGPIVFVNFQHGASELYTMNVDGSNSKRVTNDSNPDDDPAWHPKGRYIAFSAGEDIYIMDADGSNRVNLTKDSNLFSESPAFSPDGTKIVFVGGRGTSAELYIMDALTGENRVQLTRNSIAESGPVWSPDGTKIAFAANLDGDEDIHLLTVDNPEEIINLTNNDVNDSDPAFSPDGSRVAFSSLLDSNFSNIVIINSDGTDARKLTDNAVQDSEPTWSPDGTRIIYTSGINLFMLPVDTPATPTQLTNRQTESSNAAWLPVLRPE